MSELNFVKRNGTMSLEAARVNANLTLQQVHEKTGIAKGTLINYEKGRTSPTIETVMKLCKLYEVDLNQISFLP